MLKKNSFWRSKVLRKGKPDLYIVESPIDALAHYELKKNNNAFYIATNGTIAGERLEILTNYIELRKNRFNSFNLGNDFDTSGVRFNINIIGQSKLNDLPDNLTLSVSANKHTAIYTVVSNSKAKIEDFEKAISSINNTIPLTSNFDNQYRGLIKTENEKEFKLQFVSNNRKDVLTHIENLIIEKKQSPFKIERNDFLTDKVKDFSAALEAKKGIKRTSTSYWKFNNNRIDLEQLKETLKTDNIREIYKTKGVQHVVIHNWSKPKISKEIDNSFER